MTNQDCFLYEHNHTAKNSQASGIPQTGDFKTPGGVFAKKVSEKMLPLHCKAEHWFVLNYNQDEVTFLKSYKW